MADLSAWMNVRTDLISLILRTLSISQLLFFKMPRLTP